MTDVQAPLLTKKDFESDQAVRWCPGCGDYAILAQTQKNMRSLWYLMDFKKSMCSLWCLMDFFGGWEKPIRYHNEHMLF